jgi:hypothetical protein
LNAKLLNEKYRRADIPVCRVEKGVLEKGDKLGKGIKAIFLFNTPDANELAAIRHSSETGLPYGEL